MVRDRLFCLQVTMNSEGDKGRYLHSTPTCVISGVLGSGEWFPWHGEPDRGKYWGVNLFLFKYFEVKFIGEEPKRAIMLPRSKKVIKSERVHQYRSRREPERLSLVLE